MSLMQAINQGGLEEMPLSGVAKVGPTNHVLCPINIHAYCIIIA